MDRSLTPAALDAAFFWSRVAIPRRRDARRACWLYVGPRTNGGRRRVTGSVRVPRAAWVLLFGPLPAGMQVRTTCGAWNCCRPDHLVSIPTARWCRSEAPEVAA